MTSPGTEPTRADRELARNLLFPELANEMPHNLARLQFGDEALGQMERIAQALVDQRTEAAAKALEEFSVELAELRISCPNSTGSYRKASRRAWDRAAELRP